MATENLKVKITADASQAKAEIGKFKDSLKSTVGAADSATGSMLKLRSAMVALAAVKMAKAMIQNAISVAAAGDEIKDNAQKVFMSTTAYQEWGYVLKQNGIEMASLKTGMRQFAQQVAKGSDALKKYNITARDIDSAFEQAIYTIQNMSTETEKVAAATELFGSRALELMPILNLTNAETQALMETYRAIGGTMSNELIASSDTLTDSLTEMKAAWQGLKNLLAAYIIPVLSKVVQWITIAIAYVRILLKAFLGIKESFGGGGGTAKKTSLAGSSGSVAKNTGKTAGNLKKAAKHAKDLRKTLMGIDELTKLAEKATSGASGGGVGGIGGIGGGIGDIGLSDIGDLESVADVFSPETLQRIDEFRQKVEAIAEPLNGVYLILKGLFEISILGLPVQGFNDLKEGIEKLLPDLDDLKEKWNDLADNVASKYIEFKAELKEAVKQKLADLKAWWNSRTTDPKAFWAVFKEAVKQKLADLKVWWNSKTTDAKVFWANFKEAVKQNFADLKVWWGSKTVDAKTFKANFTESVKSAWNKLKNWWDKIKISAKTMTVNFKFVDKLKSAWNSLAKKINAARNKSSIVRALIPYIPTLAKGGVLTAPTTAIMGEYAGARQNPEIATPQSLMYETIQRANGDMVSAFATMTRQVIAAIEQKDLAVNIGDEQIARSAQRGNTAYYNRTGKALLSI